MNRPNRVRMPEGMAGYTSAPDFAWSGWRLKIPGGPIGGQYHGFIAPDSYGWPAGHDEIYRPAADFSGLGDVADHSLAPWDHEWGGISQAEGESLSDHVYRSPGEMRPRPNASGGANVAPGYQRRRSAGFAEAPGNYKGVGVIPPFALRTNGGSSKSVVSVPALLYHGTALPAYFPTEACPAWGCGGPRPIYGATSVVAQPPPPTTPAPVATVVSSIPPVSPAPAPTVASTPTTPAAAAAPPAMTTTAPAAVVNDPQCVALGMNGGPYPNCNVSGMTPIDSGVATPSGAAAVAAATPVDTSDISTWLNESTLISGVPNMYLAIGSAIAAYFLLKKK